MFGSRNRPYVLSDDLSVVSRAFESAVNVCCPSAQACQAYSAEIANVLSHIFPRVDLVSGSEMTGFMQDMRTKASLPLVTLYDDGMSSADLTLLLSRGVDENLQALGLIPRTAAADTLQMQINAVVAKLNAQGATEIALADDVIFSGGSLIKLANTFKNAGIAVRQAYAPIVISEGKQALRENGIDVIYNREYTKVVDETCVRDLIPGLYGGGRTCRTTAGNYRSIPYLKTYGGDPLNWASIPEAAQDFHAEGCEVVSRAYWRATRALTGRDILDIETERPLLYRSIVDLQQEDRYATPYVA